MRISSRRWMTPITAPPTMASAPLPNSRLRANCPALSAAPDHGARVEDGWRRFRGWSPFAKGLAIDF